MEMIIDYVQGNLRGKCLREFAALDLRKIPWDELKKHPIPGYELIKSSHTRRVIKFEFTPPGAEKPIPLYAKRMKIRRWRQILGSLFRETKAEREWHLGNELRSMGFDTPLAVIYAEEKSGLCFKASYIVLSEVREKFPASSLLKDIRTSSGRKNLLKILAQYLAKMHQQGFYHDDCNSKHFFLSVPNQNPERAAVAIIDLDNARLSGTPLGCWWRAKNIFQFLRSISSLTHREKLRFIIHYLYAGQIEHSAWRKFIKLANVIAFLKGASRIF